MMAAGLVGSLMTIAPTAVTTPAVITTHVAQRTETAYRHRP